MEKKRFYQVKNLQEKGIIKINIEEYKKYLENLK